MGKVFADITTSLDGFVAGPNPTLEEPLGEGGERLHEWLLDLESFKRRHGGDGGQRNRDSEILEESFVTAGATVMGRRMFSGGFGSGAWDDDPNPNGWWGDDPPFHMPVFVLTHHARKPLELQGGTTFTFVTDGVESGVQQARAAAGDKDVVVAGGADAVQQVLAAGLLDELQIHIVPLLLGGGTRLFGDASGTLPRLEPMRVIDSPAVTHVKYRVLS